MSKYGQNTSARWFWASGDSTGHANDLFVIAQGEEELWRRVRQEIDPREQCSWNGFGSSEGVVSKADLLNLVFTVWLPYGVSHNRFLFELAQVPAFARFLTKERNCDLCNYVSNPMKNGRGVFREPYSREAEAELAQRLRDTLTLQRPGRPKRG